MTPAQAKAALSRALSTHGFAATLNRGPLASPVSIACRVHLTGYSQAAIVAGTGLQEGDSKAIFAASDLAAWEVTGSKCPKKGDWITIDGRNRMIMIGWPAPPVGGEVIRYEAQIR